MRPEAELPARWSWRLADTAAGELSAPTQALWDRAVAVAGASTLVPLEEPEALAAELHRFWAGLAG